MGRRGKKNLREKIIRVSSTFFAKKGFEGVSVEEIAQELGVSKSVIFWHFGSKRALYEEVVRQNIQDLKINLEKELRRLSPQQKMLKLLDLCEDFLMEHREFIQILTRGSSGITPQVKKQLLKANKMMRESAVEILREAGVREGVEELADGIITLMHGLACQASSDWFSKKELSKFRTGVEFLLEFLMQSVER